MLGYIKDLLGTVDSPKNKSLSYKEGYREALRTLKLNIISYSRPMLSYIMCGSHLHFESYEKGYMTALKELGLVGRVGYAPGKNILWKDETFLKTLRFFLLKNIPLREAFKAAREESIRSDKHV